VILTSSDKRLAGIVGLDTSIDRDDTSRFIRSTLFGDLKINMVLFISNNIYGRGTVARQVTISKETLIDTLRTKGSWAYMKKWLKGMEDDVPMVVKDTWVDVNLRQTEGMILDCLRLKGVMGVTRLVVEGLMPVPVTPSNLNDPNKQAVGELETTPLGPRSSTVHNRETLGIKTLALASSSLTRNLNVHAGQQQTSTLDDTPPERMDVPVFQERIQTRLYLYPQCEPIYAFNCIYEALVAIADCIRCKCWLMNSLG
jgi:hypothetical protein